MIASRHHSIIYAVFKCLSRFMLWWNFRKLVIYLPSGYDSDKPVLIIANHVSWWDGFWVWYLNDQFLRRKFHFMLLESTLQKHWYFRYCGGFSVLPGMVAVRKSIDYALALLRDRENAVLMFPQGSIHSLYNSSFVFERGAQYIIDHLTSGEQVLFVANMVDYLSYSKPTVHVYTECIQADILQNEGLASTYALFYRQVLTQHSLITC